MGFSRKESKRVWIPALLLLILLALPAFAQSIEFESGGLMYQTLTHSGITVMFAELPVQIREYAVLQVAVSNGSLTSRTIHNEDFQFIRADGAVIPATPASLVVDEFLHKGGHGDAVKLISTYELGLYGLTRFLSTNGYEVRRRNANAELISPKLKAAAAASAIAFVTTRLKPSESTDGAIFFPNQGKPIGTGRLIVTIGSERFEYEVGGEHHPGSLKIRPPAAPPAATATPDAPPPNGP
jgi:hypothetical protein